MYLTNIRVLNSKIFVLVEKKTFTINSGGRIPISKQNKHIRIRV